MIGGEGDDGGPGPTLFSAMILNSYSLSSIRSSVLNVHSSIGVLLICRNKVKMKSVNLSVPKDIIKVQVMIGIIGV